MSTRHPGECSTAIKVYPRYSWTLVFSCMARTRSKPMASDVARRVKFRLGGEWRIHDGCGCGHSGSLVCPVIHDSIGKPSTAASARLGPRRIGLSSLDAVWLRIHLCRDGAPTSGSHALSNTCFMISWSRCGAISCLNAKATSRYSPLLPAGIDSPHRRASGSALGQVAEAPRGGRPALPNPSRMLIYLPRVMRGAS
jgi:hypothetical protein